MATIDWPATRAYQPQAMQFGATTPKSRFASFFTSNAQAVGHLSDRLTCTLSLPPCSASEGQMREAFLLGLASSGDLVRLGHRQRIAPMGTMRATPTVQASALAGARTISIQTIAGRTVQAGDVLQIGTQLVLARSLATANGSGVLSLSLALPIVRPITAGDAVVWDGPVGIWELMGEGASVRYQARRLQQGADVTFLQRP